MKKLLIMGGGRDANVQWIEQAAAGLGIEHKAVYINPNPEPRFEWDMDKKSAFLNGEKMDFSAAFMRYDVFSGLYTDSEFANENAANWYAVFAAWCQTHKVRMLNQDVDFLSGSKIGMLALAGAHGFEIPKTLISNSKGQMQELGNAEKYIAKPVSGGTYCVSLDDALKEAEWNDDVGASPAIVQQKLMYPEFRVYRVGTKYFAFNINSETLDSRLDKKSEIVPINIETFPSEILQSLENMTNQIRCDFCAIDLKTNPDTEKLVFLELNNGPMFMGYDKTINGMMAREMVRYLTS